MIALSVGLFLFPDLLFAVTERAAEDLLHTVPYIEAVRTR